MHCIMRDIKSLSIYLSHTDSSAFSVAYLPSFLPSSFLSNSPQCQLSQVSGSTSNQQTSTSSIQYCHLWQWWRGHHTQTKNNISYGKQSNKRRHHLRVRMSTLSLATLFLKGNEPLPWACNKEERCTMQPLNHSGECRTRVVSDPNDLVRKSREGMAMINIHFIYLPTQW